MSEDGFAQLGEIIVICDKNIREHKIMIREKFKFLIYFPLLSLILLMISAGPTQSQSTLETVQIAYTPENTILAIGFSNGVVELWDASNNLLIATVLPPLPDANLTYAIQDMSFSPNGSYIAISYGGYDSPGSLQIVDATNGQIFHLFNEGTFVGDLAWSPDGSLIVAKIVIGQGNPTSTSLLVWEIGSGNLIVDNYLGANINPFGLDWSPDGNQVVSAHFENTIMLWNTQSWTPSTIEFVADGPIWDVGWTDNGLNVIAVDNERTIYVWDSITGNRTHTINTGSLTNKYDIDIISSKGVVNGLTEVLVIDLDNEPIFETFPEPAEDVVWLDEATIVYSDANTFNIFHTGEVACDTNVTTSNTTELISAITTGNTAGSSYTLSPNALPTITGEIKIIGNGATITHDTSASDVRIFRVADGASLTLENLTLSGRDPIDNAGTVRLQAVTLAGDSDGE
ncbi:MAG: WD40 repeat domain-containing protein [Anaerolineae bacterium]